MGHHGRINLSGSVPTHSLNGPPANQVEPDADTPSLELWDSP